MGIVDKLGFGKINCRVINASVRLVGKGSWKDGKTTSSVVEFSDGTVINGCTYNDAVGTYLLDERSVRFLVTKNIIESVILNDGRVIERPIRVGVTVIVIATLIAGIIGSALVALIPFGIALIPFIMLYAIIQAFHAPKTMRAYTEVLREFYRGYEVV